MDYNLLKTGSSSIVLGRLYYSKYFQPKERKLLKITKTSDIHNEFKFLKLVRRIDNYDKYYSIPDELTFLLKPEEDFYKYCQKLIKTESIFYGNVKCVYMDYAGSKDMLDTLNELIQYDNYTFWCSYRRILKFTKHIMRGLKFLHNKEICHLDIKPENIIIDKYRQTFKIIDFGFSSMEPFDDYIEYTKGTPGYFPKDVLEEKPTEWLPKVIANDFIITNGKFPLMLDRKQVYKIDSYSFGRVLYFLKHAYDRGKTYECHNFEKTKGKKIDKIIDDLIYSNVYERLTVSQCLHKYFRY